MTENEALATSNGFVDMDGMLGYFGFQAANHLVGTGKYVWQQAGWMGYVIRKAPEKPKKYGEKENE
jgi:hypothetical protein